MDEPTAGVDVQARKLILKIKTSFLNSTTIVSFHALEEAEAMLLLKIKDYKISKLFFYNNLSVKIVVGGLNIEKVSKFE
jgi:ABC-type Na+ transport system ATPase subunit NatA